MYGGGARLSEFYRSCGNNTSRFRFGDLRTSSTHLYRNFRASVSMSNLQPAGACLYERRHPDIHLPDTYCIRARHKFHRKAALFPVNADIIPVGIFR
jgi:hypothetical protein